MRLAQAAQGGRGWSAASPTTQLADQRPGEAGWGLARQRRPSQPRRPGQRGTLGAVAMACLNTPSSATDSMATAAPSSARLQWTVIRVSGGTGAAERNAAGRVLCFLGGCAWRAMVWPALERPCPPAWPSPFHSSRLPPASPALADPSPPALTASATN